MDIYTVKSTDIVYETSVDFGSRACVGEVHIVQYDNSQPIIAVELFKNSKKFVLPEGYEADIRVGKKDGTFVLKRTLGCNPNRNILYFDVDVQMTLMPSRINPIVQLSYGEGIVGSSGIPLIIDMNPVQEGAIESQTEYPAIMERISIAETNSKEAKAESAIAKAEADDAKSKMDNIENTYATKTEVDGKLDSADFNSVNIVSTLGTTPVNRATGDANGNSIVDTYATKTEVDGKLDSADFNSVNIVSTLGTTPVNRATGDANGNSIVDTYATEAIPSSTLKSILV